jgi:hypothetical protein
LDPPDGLAIFTATHIRALRLIHAFMRASGIAKAIWLIGRSPVPVRVETVPAI